MKLRFLFILLSALSGINGLARSVHPRIELTVDDLQPKIEELYDCCKLMISATNDGNKYNISIDIENTTNFYIFLFGHSYTEKDLRKQKPSIRFDKVSYGSTSRDIVICKGLQDGNVSIMPGTTHSLSFRCDKNNIVQCELPLYIATYKKKGFLRKAKYMIERRDQVILDLHINNHVQPVVDNDYEVIKQSLNELKGDISKLTFCTSPKHKPLSKDQKEPFEERIQKLQRDIDKIMSKWEEGSDEYKRYNDLLKELKGIKFKETVCSNCKGPIPHPTCKYCQWTPQQVYRNLDSTYKKIDNRKINKSEAISNVKLIRKAWTGGCPNLTKSMKNDPSAKNKIEDLYNDIINY